MNSEERRRRLLTRTLPLAAVALVAFIFGAVVGAPGSPEKDAAGRFADAWANGEYAAMYKELNEASRARLSVNEMAIAYREAAETATLRTLDAHLQINLRLHGHVESVEEAEVIHGYPFRR